MIQERIIFTLVMRRQNQEPSLPFSHGHGARQGVIGDGQVEVTSYVVPKGAMAFWENRLQNFQIPYSKNERFGEEYLKFDDPHGLHLEIVEREEGEINTWTFGGVTPEVAIKGFGGATLLSAQPVKTAELLENVMGLEKVAEEGNIIRFRSEGEFGNIIDLKLTTVGIGINGCWYRPSYRMASSG